MADEWVKVEFYGYGDPEVLKGMDPLTFWKKLANGEVFSMVDSLAISGEKVTNYVQLPTEAVTPGP